MADAPLKAREGGECDLQINPPYRALGSLSVGNVAGKEISDPASTRSGPKQSRSASSSSSIRRATGPPLSSAIVSAATAISQT
jgi:hypothetical protein